MTDLTPIVLTTDRLAVEISQPGAAYAGTRFDWTGFITQVTLDGKHTFCVPEDYEPGKGTGGIGICNEFGIDLPIGYEDAVPGEPYPKLGVGLLTRLDKPVYSFWYPHVIATHFPISISTFSDKAVFTLEPRDCRGFSTRLVKTLSVTGNQLSVHYHLQNTGSRPIHTNEYVHNFIGLDKHLLGPDYILRLACPIAFEDTSSMFQTSAPKWMQRFFPSLIKSAVQRAVERQQSILRVEGTQLNLRAAPKEAFYFRFSGLALTDQPQWELVHQPSGVSMREYDNFAPCRIALWGTTHVISVEIFIDIDLKPGESLEWNRRFEFSA
jgi:hypothetical protein